jgi:hypothetical protein
MSTAAEVRSPRTPPFQDVRHGDRFPWSSGRPDRFSALAALAKADLQKQAAKPSPGTTELRLDIFFSCPRSSEAEMVRLPSRPGPLPICGPVSPTSHPHLPLTYPGYSDSFGSTTLEPA